MAAPLTETATVIPRGRGYKHNARLNRFAWLTCVATLLLICSGGMVTSKGVGLAVPDWPTTFGYNMFLFPVSKWVGGILFEHTHRLIASVVGFLTIILAVWIWRAEDRQWVRNLGVIALAGVILQGILGGLRVTMLKDEIGIFHACIAQAFLGLLVFLALVTTGFWRSLGRLNLTGLTGQVLRRLRALAPFAIAITVAIYGQLGLGATMRHQHRDLAIFDFPTANGAWIPDTSAAALAKINAWRDMHGFSEVTAFQIWLQMAHRLLAFAIAIAIIGFCLWVWRQRRQQPRANSALQLHVAYATQNCNGRDGRDGSFIVLRRLSIFWLLGVFVQLTLGAWTIWSNKAADVATAHVAVGALMLSFGVMISAICWRVKTVSRLGGSGSEPDRHSALPIPA